MTINDFVAANNNKALDFDGQYGPQCMDLIQFWAKALGKRQFTGNANNVPGENHDQWAWINNSPNAVPTPGSIMCFAPNNPATHTGQFGHVDIFLSGDVHSFTALDQNWAGIQRCVEVHHGSYAGVLGWLQPTGVGTSPAPAPSSSTGTATCIRTANVRTAPSSGAAITSTLQPGNTFTYTNKVTGDTVNGNNVWYHSTLGHFVWSGNCTG